MTRVWPIAMIQKPTVIFMVSGFMNSTRIIYLDGRKHTDPDLVIPSFNGESIGHWEGDTLVVDTVGFVDDHHWLDNGIPASDQSHIVERMRLIGDGATLEIEYTASRSQELGGRMEMDEALETRGRHRYHRSVVPAGSERAYAQRDVEISERSLTR